MNHTHMDPYSTARRQGIGSLAPCFTLFVALSASACATADEAPLTQPGGNVDTGPSATETVGRMLDGPQTCTAPNTICVKLLVPLDMAGVTDGVHFDIYDSAEPPTHPPNGYAGVFPGAQLQAGVVQNFELTDGGLQGNYWLYSVIYMPGGGLFGLPIAGVDFVQATLGAALRLDGSPLNLVDPIELRRFMVP